MKSCRGSATSPTLWREIVVQDLRGVQQLPAIVLGGICLIQIVIQIADSDAQELWDWKWHALNHIQPY